MVILDKLDIRQDDFKIVSSRMQEKRFDVRIRGGIGIITGTVVSEEEPKALFQFAFQLWQLNDLL